MEQVYAHGWTADWLVGWLASIGVTYRDPDIKLSWTDEPIPSAVFHVDSIEQLEAVMPTMEELEQLAIARHREGLMEFPRNPTRVAFQSRARAARLVADPSLGATMSDVGLGDRDDLAHSPFDATAPKGITVAQRLVSACGAAGESLEGSLRCVRRHSNQNGLGFDLRRLGPRSVPGKALWIDPHAETLAFYGALLFTQCGESTRGWQSGSRFRTGAFRWATWNRPLDWAAIDVFIDHFHAATDDHSEILGRAFDSVAYCPAGSSDTTRGYDGLFAEAD